MLAFLVAVLALLVAIVRAGRPFVSGYGGTPLVEIPSGRDPARLGAALVAVDPQARDFGQTLRRAHPRQYERSGRGEEARQRVLAIGGAAHQFWLRVCFLQPYANAAAVCGQKFDPGPFESELQQLFVAVPQVFAFFESRIVNALSPLTFAKSFCVQSRRPRAARHWAGVIIWLPSSTRVDGIDSGLICSKNELLCVLRTH